MLSLSQTIPADGLHRTPSDRLHHVPRPTVCIIAPENANQLPRRIRYSCVRTAKIRVSPDQRPRQINAEYGIRGYHIHQYGIHPTDTLGIYDIRPPAEYGIDVYDICRTPNLGKYNIRPSAEYDIDVYDICRTPNIIFILLTHPSAYIIFVSPRRKANMIWGELLLLQFLNSEESFPHN